MQAVYKIIELAASSKATIFIKGESGTGKELAAEAIHQLSPRSTQGKLIAINCAAIPKDLMESEIFGHVKGAFTGAIGDREGAAKQADGGTLFLDEIGELDLELQSKLLRFVQSGTFRPVGGTKDIKVDVRIVCATNRDPLKEVEEGRFREDLYYRLHVIPLELPPLRERGTDIIEIGQSFLQNYAKEENKAFRSFSDESKEILKSWRWPGNVRELQNMLHNLVVLNDGDIVTTNMLPTEMQKQEIISDIPAEHISNNSSKTIPNQENTRKELIFLPTKIENLSPLSDLERAIIENAIEICDGNIPRAAGYLGVSPSTIYRKRVGWGE